MNKLLFIINGLGLGNSTRCDAIIQLLVSKGVGIDVLTSGNGIFYFKNCGHIANVYEWRSFYYGKSGGKLSIFRMILYIPHFILICILNVKYLKKLLRQNTYKAIIIDSDYMVFWLRKRIKVPIIAINNSDFVIRECKKLPSMPKSIRMQYYIEQCDYWFHKNIPDIVLSPSFLSNYMDGEKFRHFAPFIREGFKTKHCRNSVSSILVMLSGSQFRSNVTFIEYFTPPKGVKIDIVGREGKTNEWITYHGKILNNINIVDNADMMVVNGGYSAVSEGIVLKKPMIVIPVENHAEQFINAWIIERLGLGLMATIENVNSKINEMISMFPEFVEAHSRFSCPSNGARDGVRLIEEILTK